MDIPTSSLNNQNIQKKSHFRSGFVFLLIASVGLNIFLLFFDQESNVASLPQDAGMTSQISYEQVLPEVPSKEVSQPVAVIKPVSYAIPSK
jgi:glucose uptake protein GlcU